MVFFIFIFCGLVFALIPWMWFWMYTIHILILFFQFQVGVEYFLAELFQWLLFHGRFFLECISGRCRISLVSKCNFLISALVHILNSTLYEIADTASYRSYLVLNSSVYRIPPILRKYSYFSAVFPRFHLFRSNCQHLLELGL